MPTDAELGWVAGFFDGEGHVSYQRTRPNKKTDRVSAIMQAVIPQAASNIQVLEYFQSIIGFGKMHGPYPMPNGKPQFKLLYGVKEVENLFKILKPNLQAEKTSDFQRALLGYIMHDPKITPQDIERMSKLGCTQCGEEWNGMMCLKCGYM